MRYPKNKDGFFHFGWQQGARYTRALSFFRS